MLCCKKIAHSFDHAGIAVASLHLNDDKHHAHTELALAEYSFVSCKVGAWLKDWMRQCAYVKGRLERLRTYAIDRLHSAP